MARPFTPLVKGVIFNILEGFVTETWGEEVYDEILRSCPLHTKTAFIGPGTYPDTDLMTIVARTVDRLGVTVPEALHAFGRYAFPHLARRVTPIIAGFDHPKPFLMALDSVIHVEVRKLWRDAETPRLTYTDTGAASLVLHYASKRQLCPLVGGLLEGLADHFHTAIAWHELRCASVGHPTCDFAVDFVSSP